MTERSLAVAEAVERILADIRPLASERLPLLDALDRVLAEDVTSPLTLPPWTNSAMDGYAVRTADVARASADVPVTLRVLETVAAGAFPSAAIGAGDATRIMTGAPVPEGADCVIRVEDTNAGSERVVIRDARDAGKNFRMRGEDLHAGDTVLHAGTPLGAAQIGVLASVGHGIVEVHRRPRVAIMSSGDELVDLDRFREVLDGKKIVSSNGYTLQALVRETGGEPMNFGIARDDPADMRERLERALGCDLIITSAGASVGEYDFTRQVLESLGAEMQIWRVRLRPGAPVGFGFVGAVPWIGLPGNPVSTMVTFELFVRPVIRRMLGHTRLHRRPVPVVCEDAVTLGAKLTHFLRVVVRVREDGVLTARLTGPQGSGILSSMARANALLIVPEDRPSIAAGDTMHALLLDESASLAESFAL